MELSLLLNYDNFVVFVNFNRNKWNTEKYENPKQTN